MNRIQKTVAACMAFTITLLGAAGVTAPLAFASVQAQSVSGAQHTIQVATLTVRRV